MRTGGWLSVLIAVLLTGCSGDDESDAGGGASGGDNQFANSSGNPAGFGPSGSAGSGEDFGPTASGACAEGSARTSRVKPRVVLLLDGSCSMSTGYPSNGGPSATACRAGGDTRWGALRSALLDPTSGVVTRLQGAIEFGLVVFGTQPACPQQRRRHRRGLPPDTARPLHPHGGGPGLGLRQHVHAADAGLRSGSADPAAGHRRRAQLLR
jgi:hypothetical protein